jgi:outer membrane protein TolC
MNRKLFFNTVNIILLISNLLKKALLAFRQVVAKRDLPVNPCQVTPSRARPDITYVNLRFVNTVKIILLISLAIFTLTSMSLAQQVAKELSLTEAIKLALASDNNLLAAQASLRASEMGIKTAKAAYYPRLVLSGSYSRMTKVNEITLPIQVPGVDNSIQISTQNPFDANLGLSYELYTFGRRPAGVRLSKTESSTAELNYRLVQKRIYDMTARTYLAAVFTGETYMTLQTEKERFEQIYNLAGNRFDQELMSEFELLQMELRLEQYELSVLEAANASETARLNLARLLNVPSDQLSGLADNLEGDYFSLPELAGQNDMLSLREDYKQAVASTEMAKLARKIKKSAYFPSISAFGAYDLRNGYQPDLDKLESNYSVGVNLNWLLFDGFARRAEISKQDYLTKASGYMADDLSLRIPVEVKNARLALANSESRIEVGNQTLIVAEKAMSIARIRFDLGDISMIEFLEAENQYSQANLGLLKLKYDYLQTQLDLKSAAGYYPELKALN